MINGTILIFDIVNFPFIYGDVPRRISYEVYISHLIRFARASNNVSDFNYRKKTLLPSSLGMAIVIINFLKCFQSFITDTVGWWKKYNVNFSNTE